MAAPSEQRRVSHHRNHTGTLRHKGDIRPRPTGMRSPMPEELQPPPPDHSSRPPAPSPTTAGHKATARRKPMRTPTAAVAIPTRLSEFRATVDGIAEADEGRADDDKKQRDEPSTAMAETPAPAHDRLRLPRPWLGPRNRTRGHASVSCTSGARRRRTRHRAPCRRLRPGRRASHREHRRRQPQFTMSAGGWVRAHGSSLCPVACPGRSPTPPVPLPFVCGAGAVTAVTADAMTSSTAWRYVPECVLGRVVVCCSVAAS
jgi:hypothetical protein